jgi:hypothetical protein
MSNEIDLTTANTTIIVPCKSGGISEATLNMMAEAQGKIIDKMSQEIKEGKSELVVMNPKASLLPELEYIGDGKYRFKKT